MRIHAFVNIVILSAVLVLWPGNLQAEEALGCQPGEDWIGCFNRLLEVKAQEAAKKERSATAEQTAERAQDQVGAAMAGGGAGSEQSFLPLLLTSLGFDGLTNEQGQLQVAYNFPLRGAGTFGIELMGREAKPFEQLVEAIPMAERESRTTEFGKQIGDLDDLEVKLMWSFRKGGEWRYGRDLAQYREDVFDRIFDDVQSRVDTIHEATAATREAEATQGLTGLLNNPSLLEAPESPTPESRRIDSAVVAAATAVVDRHLALGSALETTGFYGLADLVTNQPQLYLSASFRERDELVGRDEVSLKLSFELGMGNLNGLADSCGSFSSIDLDCYEKFMKDSMRAKARRSWRLALEASYTELDDYASPLEDVDLVIGKAERFEAKLTGGFDLFLKRTGELPARFDLEAKLQDWSDDPMLQDRLVGTATLTQPLNADVGVSVSLVWASKPEFRGEVDEELSARAGLRFKLNRKSK